MLHTKKKKTEKEICLRMASKLLLWQFEVPIIYPHGNGKSGVGIRVWSFRERPRLRISLFKFYIGEFKVVGVDEFSKLKTQRENRRGLGWYFWVGSFFKGQPEEAGEGGVKAGECGDTATQTRCIKSC